MLGGAFHHDDEAVATQVTSDPDSILLDQYVRTQDPVAFDQIARRYRSMVFATARRVTHSHHDAEDVAQNCFLELAKKASSIRTSIAAFLHSTATRRAIDLLRDQSRRKKHEQRAAADRVEPVVDVNSPERAWDEISPEVDQAIDRLPENLKTFVILYFLRGLSVADIVVESGLKKGMVERRLQVGVRRLRAELAKGDRVVSAGVLAAGLKSGASLAVPPTLTAATGRMAFAASLQRPPIHLPLRLQPVLRPFGGSLPAWLIPSAAAAVLLSTIAWIAVNWGERPQPATPYDEINRLYSPYISGSGASRLAVRTTEIASDDYSFWRGAQPLFYEWCAANCKDWLSDSSAYTLCNASPNLEDAMRPPGVCNTDNSARLPVQIELLQGMILTRLSTHASAGSRAVSSLTLSAELCSRYRSVLDGVPPALAAPAPRRALLSVEDYLDQDQNLKPVIFGRQGSAVEFLRPCPLNATQLERLLADALSRNPKLQAACGTSEPKVRDARSCVRKDALVTDGDLVLLVQLDGTGTLLEMRHQTPSAAELAQAIPRDSRTPARRAAEDAAALSPMGTNAVGWTSLEDQSFTVTPINLFPQACRAGEPRVSDPCDAGRAWATATAITHLGDPHHAALAARVTPKLEADLASRCDAYLEVLHSQLQNFNSDWRVARDRSRVNAMTQAKPE